MKIGIEIFTASIKTLHHNVIFVLCALFLAYVIAKAIKKTRSNFPPGPMGLPIVGYLPFMSKDAYLDFIKLGERYGDVFSVRLGSQNFVILHGAEVIKETMSKPEFLGKPPINVLQLINPYSAFFGPHLDWWKEQRKFVVHSIKELGLGKTKIEVDVMDEINHFIDVLKSHNGKPIDVKESVTASISNNISALVIGKRYEYDDPDRKLLDKNLDAALESMAQMSPDVLYPWLRRIPFAMKLLSVGNSLAAYNNFRKFFRKEIDIHKESLDIQNIRDFIDRYLLEIDLQKEKNPNTSFHHAMLMSNAIDIYVPGSETTGTALLWIIYIMAVYRDVQKKVQEEIMEVLGPDRKPEFSDMKSMPYTNAVILEVLRWKTMLPLSLMRYTSVNSTIGGYDIPKGTLIFANFWNAHNDPRYWDEPNKFVPKRFLSKDGKSIEKSNNFMGFSLGKRVCPGESMAIMSMFLYFTSMLQKFDIAFPDGVKPTFKAKLTVTNRLDPFIVKFIPKTQAL